MSDTEFRIALLGNFTTELAGNVLRDECVKAGLGPSIYNAPFRQYHQEVIDKNSGFYSFQPDLTILMFDIGILCPECFEFPASEDINGNWRETRLDALCDSVKTLVLTINANLKTKIIINNFQVPYHTPSGILDNRSAMGLKRMINVLNMRLEDFAAATDYAYVFDYNGFCSYMGHDGLEDGKLRYLVNCTLSYPALRQLGREYMRYILPLTSLNRKCLVLDLDRTLWGGIAAEDGISGIRLDISGPGRSYYDFQKELLNLHRKGVLLAVNSKNNPEDALEILQNHPHMLLRKEYFSSIKTNWRDKASNMLDIAAELNIGVDSLVFFDDNPVEREIVKKLLPQVEVIDVPADPAKYCYALKNVPFFETLQLTAEDEKRNSMLEQDRIRIQSKETFKNLEEYLASLETAVTVMPADDFNMPRISQLTLKTNQFNMTTKRYQVSDIKTLLGAGGCEAYCCSVSDKFGDSGITGCCIVRSEDGAARIDTFLLSCRVLGRNVEYSFLAAVLKRLRDRGVGRITAEYRPTAKNRANADFYKKAGFIIVRSDDSATLYELREGMPVLEFDYIRVIPGKGEEMHG